MKDSCYYYYHLIAYLPTAFPCLDNDNDSDNDDRSMMIMIVPLAKIPTISPLFDLTGIP